MAVIVYGTGQSRAIRTLWMLEELGVPYEHRPIDFLASTRTPEFLAVNPNGRIPAIVTEEGALLWESMSINLYLAKRYGGELACANPMQEALATQWSFWAITEVEKDLLEVLFFTLGLMEHEKDMARAAEHEQLLERPLKVLDAHLRDRNYLISESFTVADLNVASLFPWAKMARIDLRPYPEIHRWTEACLSRPAMLRARERP